MRYPSASIAKQECQCQVMRMLFFLSAIFAIYNSSFSGATEAVGKANAAERPLWGLYKLKQASASDLTPNVHSLTITTSRSKSKIPAQRKAFPAEKREANRPNGPFF